MTNVSLRERRTSRGGEEFSPAELVRANIASAQCQLDEARTSLIAARQRVASLQAAAENWSEFADLLAPAGGAASH